LGTEAAATSVRQRTNGEQPLTGLVAGSVGASVRYRTEMLFASR
jgi:hypothetical protein